MKLLIPTSLLLTAVLTTVLTACILLALTQVASPQDGRFELAGVFATTFQQELDATDLGIGARAIWSRGS